MVGLSEYTSKQKESHRGWVWNSIAGRFSPPDRRDALAMYLVGPNGADADVAVSKGFARGNLFAVDSNIDAVSSSRGRGDVSLCIDIQHAIEAWSAPPLLSVIWADSCGSLDFFWKLHASLVTNKCLAHRGVLGVNLQRGRENTAGWRGLQLHAMQTMRLGDGEQVGRHRGRAAALIVFINWAYHNGAGDVIEGKYGESAAANLHRLWWNAARPAFSSYKNGPRGVRMDSVILNWHGQIMQDIDWNASVGTAAWAERLAARRKLAAAKAIRTQKLNRRNKRNG